MSPSVKLRREAISFATWDFARSNQGLQMGLKVPGFHVRKNRKVLRQRASETNWQAAHTGRLPEQHISTPSFDSVMQGVTWLPVALLPTNTEPNSRCLEVKIILGSHCVSCFLPTNLQMGMCQNYAKTIAKEAVCSFWCAFEPIPQRLSTKTTAPVDPS